MKIDISKNSSYKQVYITEGNTVIDLGLLTAPEQTDLGETLLNGASELIDIFSIFKICWENMTEYERQNCLEFIGVKTDE